MPSSRFEHTATAAAPPDRVWAALQEADTWAGIGPIERVWDAVHRDGMLAGYRWSTNAAGRRWEGSARTIEAVPGESITLALHSPEVNGSLTAALAADGEDGTTVTVTLHAESVGLLSTMFWGAVAGAIGNGFPGHVEEFAARF
jgi:uncharacterized protein YndB with AHSA1/START domain